MRSLALLVSAALVLVLASGAAAAERKPWDQERVTQLAVELADAAKAVRQTFRKQPSEVVGTQERARQDYLAILRGLETSTKQLASRLQGGAGYEETLPIARKIRTQLRDAETKARQLMETAQMEAVYAPADRLLEELGPYYFGAAPQAS